MRKKSHHVRERRNVDEQGNVYGSLKPTFDELIVSLDELKHTSAEFLRTDVETALTFSAIALQTDDLSKKQRNCRNARKGYDTIRRLAGRVELSPDDEQFLSERLWRLKSELLQLGEVF